MKRLFLSLFTAGLLMSMQAQEFDISKTAITDELLSRITGVNAPQIINDCIVFTAEHKSHFVGIAFDFENFKKIHPFKLRTFRNFDDEETDSWFFYILDIPKDAESISYRLIIDGLWTVDPQNPNSEYNRENGIRLSKVDINRETVPVTQIERSNLVHFVYKGQSGQKIRLGGSFTNWDSWIYTLSEVKPGVYTLDLHLPEGTYYYNFYNGMQSIVDSANPERAYTADGRVASVLKITGIPQS